MKMISFLFYFSVHLSGASAQECSAKRILQVKQAERVVYAAIPKQDCIVSESEWSLCNNGIQTRTNTILSPSRYGGTECPPLTQTKPCEATCGFKVQDWSLCDPLTGKTSRSKKLVFKNSKSTKSCPPEVYYTFLSPTNKVTETKDCSVDCVLSWTQWSDCASTSMFREMKQVVIYHKRGNGTDCTTPLPPLYKSCATDKIIVPRNASVRLTNRAYEYINIHSIDVYNGEGNGVSALGTPSMSSMITGLHNGLPNAGPQGIISGRVSGAITCTLKNAIEWMDIDFAQVDTISKIVINNRFDGSVVGPRIIGCTLTVFVGGIQIFQRVISNADHLSRVGNALTFERTASVRITNKAGQYLVLHSIHVFGVHGKEVSNLGTPSMSSIFENRGPMSLISKRTNGTINETAHTMNGNYEWVDIKFALLDGITKIVLNLKEFSNWHEIIGSKLTVTIGGLSIYNRVIRSADFNARNGNALTFGLSSSIRITNRAATGISIYSILVYSKEKSTEISALGIPSSSSIHNNDLLLHGPLNINSKRTDLLAFTKNSTVEWLNLEFPLVDTISKIVINNHGGSFAENIIGCTLTVTTGGFVMYNHVITRSNYNSRVGNAITFGNTANVRLTSRAGEFLSVQGISVYGRNGSDISETGTATMSSVHDNRGPLGIESRYGNSHTLNGPTEWINVEYGLVDTITKVVINNYDWDAGISWIIGSKLTISAEGITIFDRIITSAEFNARISNKLTFEISATVRLMSPPGIPINLRNILVYNEKGTEISATGVPSMSSITLNRTFFHGPSNIISGSSEMMVHTDAGISEWLNIDFALVDSISKIVINNREDFYGNRIIGCTLIVTVGDITKHNHTITQANYDARVGNALSFEFSTVRLTNKVNEYINVHSILVYDEIGAEISSTGKPTMSSIFQNNHQQYGPLRLISGAKDNDTFAITNNGTIEWMNIEFSLVNRISKVVLNNWGGNGHRMVGTTLSITVGGVNIFNHVITQTNYDDRSGNALLFGAASIRLTNTPNQHIAISNILVYNGNGVEISTTGVPSMSSVLHNDHGPSNIISGKLRYVPGTVYPHTLNGSVEWMHINFLFLDSISKVVIVKKDTDASNEALRIVGSRLTVTVGGEIKFNHTITRANFDINLYAISFGNQ